MYKQQFIVTVSFMGANNGFLINSLFGVVFMANRKVLNA